MAVATPLKFKCPFSRFKTAEASRLVLGGTWIVIVSLKVSETCEVQLCSLLNVISPLTVTFAPTMKPKPDFTSGLEPDFQALGKFQGEGTPFSSSSR